MLGCTAIETPQVNETGSTYICIHPDDNDRDGANNVLYLSEIRAAQYDLEVQLKRTIGGDSRAGRGGPGLSPQGRDAALWHPPFRPALSHVREHRASARCLGELHRSGDAGPLQSHGLRPDDPRALTKDLIQAFVYTDIIATGLFCLGQVIELQAQRGG